jgi:hypothetical protein
MVQKVLDGDTRMSVYHRKDKKKNFRKEREEEDDFSTERTLRDKPTVHSPSSHLPNETHVFNSMNALSLIDT